MRIVALLIGLLVVLGCGPQGNAPSAPVTTPSATSPAVQAVTHVDPAVLRAVNTGGLANPLTPVTATPVLKDAGGKPIVLYVGAEFCPFCASERWSLVVALSRFGTFSKLALSQSPSTHGFPEFHTFSFAGSQYSSQYMDFQGVEAQDREQRPLQALTPEQEGILKQYDAPPYVPSRGGIPFTSIANQYLAAGSGYNATLLEGHSWEDITARLRNAHDPITQAIVGNANYLTAGICQVTGQQPGSVCRAAPIVEIQQQMAKAR